MIPKPAILKYGGSGITETAFRWIKEHIPAGSSVLELGSGDVSTRVLCERYRVTSVEDNPDFMNRYMSHYIYAPLVDGWYDPAVLRSQLPEDYVFLLVDGPTGSAARCGFQKHFGLFKHNVPIMIDDTWREPEKQMAVALAAKGFDLIVSENFRVLLPQST